MKKIYLLLPLFIISCGHSDGITTQNNEENLIKLKTKFESVGEIQVNPELLKSYMTFDVLGGVFRKSSTATTNSIVLESKGLSTNKEKTTGKLSISLPPPVVAESTTPPEEPEPIESEQIEIDYSNQYVGYEGEGKLVISALGAGEESDGIRHLSSLTLRFLFFNYAFNNPCLGNIYLDGEVQCEISGDYKIEKGEFLGQAHCMHGPKDDPIPILYITSQRFYEIGVDANLTIDGSIYQYKNYRYEGKITIDGENLKVEDLINSGSCS